ncbi:MAG TPA: FmdB family zinc ribbon protein [Planctomycetota bacterium]|nr:FmdB family zinc ribbon protein [Planctomycetota bacterium]
MPTYEYECTVCGHRFEEFQSITAAALEDCPKCGKKVKRLLGNGSGIIFKGSGFYQTDYRSKEYKERLKAESSSSNPPASSGSDKK